MHLVDDARQAWRWWSVHMAAIAGLIAASLVAQPQILTGLVAYVPEAWRPAAASVAGIMVFAAPTLVRLIKQGSQSNDQ